MSGILKLPNADTFRGLFGLLSGGGLKPFSQDIAFRAVEGIEKPFAPRYERYIRPKVEQFEERRITALKSLGIRLLVTIGVLTVVIFATSFAFFLNEAQKISDEVFAVVFYGSIGAVMGVVWWTSRPVVKYRSSVKSKIYPLVFKYFGPDFVYRERGALSARSVKESGIIPDFEDEEREDYVRGSWKDVRLELTETKLTEEQGSGKNRRTVTLFQGLLIVLTMNKKFSGRTIVKRDFGKVLNWLTDKFDRKLEAVRLEDPRFERKFEVYSTDQVEARYLLTPTFMERLMELRAVFNNAPIQASFFDDKLLLTIETGKDRFETASIFRPATFVGEINTILDEMPAIFRIIEVLKLDQRTGL
ncbi:MAG: DUF3137 domain-containing protein [Rhodospirillales bacterium]|jgi:hypothetical protein|nr:DUF3137 domain-containing protein [Rhodospirillales bacterium]